MENMEIPIEVPRGTDLIAEASSKFWSNLKWRALFCLLEHKKDASISQLAAALDMPLDQAVVAIESLIRLGMVTATQNGYEQTKNFFVRSPDDRKTQEQIVKDFVLSNTQINNRILETASQQGHLTKSLSYNSNQKNVNKLYESFQKAIDEFKKESDNSESDGVYVISNALIKMTGDLK